MTETKSGHLIEGYPGVNRCEDVVEYFIERNDSTARDHVRIIFGLFYSFVFAAGLLGNGLVIASVWRYPALQTVRNFFIVSLSCSDIVVCLTSLPITPFVFIKKVWIFGSFLCYAFPLFQGMSILISTFTLMAVAVDRYILIVFPTKRPIQRAQAVPMIVCIWALAAGVCSPMIAHYRYYYGPERANFMTSDLEAAVAAYPNSTEPAWSSSTESIEDAATTSGADEPLIVFCGYFCEEAWPSERVQKIYGTFVLILQFLVPLIVIAFCYSHIWIRLGRSAKMKNAMNASKKLQGADCVSNADQSPSLRLPLSNQRKQRAASTTSTGQTSAEARQQAVLRRKRRTNRMLIAMVFVFACSWCPHVTMNLFRDLSWLPVFVYDQMYFYSLLCHAIAMSSTVWNPLLYSFMNGAFRSAFSELLPCFGRIKRTLSGRVSSKRARAAGDQLRQRPVDAESNSAARTAPDGCGGATVSEQQRQASIRTAQQPIPIVSVTNSDSGKLISSNRRLGGSTPATTTETAALLPDTDTSKSIPSTAVDLN